ncbi:dinucleotide-utilizing enzyme [Microbacterium radiodurans]|uniref:Dinucleotide-utilizing enzyme n=1 Tax=Microbacterium radiodurans TaxID=661398 RepID=A0A5J5ISY6_9MICO|nr:dinucleotide-utilizing enzyme [Microbacterium radiodurans]KAA9087121.1 dinucleotide-utilizing enzyme [Microbacterium radiodurans]
MTVHPRLVRSVPFWTLVVLSVAAIGAGAYVLVDKLGTMEATILDGTATGVEVYVGQVWGVFGAVLVGAGVVGLALALAVAAARALVPAAPRNAETAAEVAPVVETAPATAASPVFADEPAASRDLSDARDAAASEVRTGDETVATEIDTATADAAHRDAPQR